MTALHDQGPPPPCPAPFNLAAHVLARAGARPGKVALAILRPSGAERWSYERLEAAVRMHLANRVLAKILHIRGLRFRAALRIQTWVLAVKSRRLARVIREVVSVCVLADRTLCSQTEA